VRGPSGKVHRVRGVNPPGSRRFVPPELGTRPQEPERQMSFAWIVCIDGVLLQQANTTAVRWRGAPSHTRPCLIPGRNGRDLGALVCEGGDQWSPGVRTVGGGCAAGGGLGGWWTKSRSAASAGGMDYRRGSRPLRAILRKCREFRGLPGWWVLAATVAAITAAFAASVAAALATALAAAVLSALAAAALTAAAPVAELEQAGKAGGGREAAAQR
jgi:hypothetical protein